MPGAGGHDAAGQEKIVDRTSLRVWRARGFANWKKERSGTMSVEGCIVATVGAPEAESLPPKEI